MAEKLVAVMAGKWDSLMVVLKAAWMVAWLVVLKAASTEAVTVAMLVLSMAVY